MRKQWMISALAFVCGFAAILGGLYAYQIANAPKAAPADLPGLLWPDPKQIGEFELTDQHRTSFDLSRVKKKWTLWYFGYTNCPDACPLALSALTAVDKELESRPDFRERVQYSFVSVDPARDSLEHLGKYVSFFNPAFIAATGTDEQIERITRQFGVLYGLEEPDGAGNYVVNHTAAILLTDPQARLVALFRQPHEAADITDRLLRISEFLN